MHAHQSRLRVLFDHRRRQNPIAGATHGIRTPRFLGVFFFVLVVRKEGKKSYYVVCVSAERKFKTWLAPTASYRPILRVAAKFEMLSKLPNLLSLNTLVVHSFKKVWGKLKHRSFLRANYHFSEKMAYSACCAAYINAPLW